MSCECDREIEAYIKLQQELYGADVESKMATNEEVCSECRDGSAWFGLVQSGSAWFAVPLEFGGIPGFCNDELRC